MDFNEDLKIGKKAENEFASILVKTGMVASLEIPQGRFKDYDVRIKTVGGKEITYEVKYDGIYPTSKCVGIEYECKGVPSGIMTSKSDYYVYKLGSDFFFAEKSKLLELLMLSTTKKACQGGDDGTSKLRVIPEQEFYTVAKKIGKN